MSEDQITTKDARDWVIDTVDELQEIAEWFDKRGIKSNGDFLRRCANMLEILAGAYETVKRRENKLTEASLWEMFCDALDEGRISVILEKATDTIDGGIITSDIGDIIDHLTER